MDGPKTKRIWPKFGRKRRRGRGTNEREKRGMKVAVSSLSTMVLHKRAGIVSGWVAQRVEPAAGNRLSPLGHDACVKGTYARFLCRVMDSLLVLRICS